MLQPILINGQWTQSTNPSGSFHAHNPASKQELSERAFPISSWTDLEAMLEAGASAARAMEALEPTRYAEFLESYASEIEGRTEALVDAANLETALPKEPRLANVELPRTINQLRLAAQAVREGSWSRATIDTASGIRSVHGPLGGPVVVFGPNNFPYAYNGIAGGDFAAAIAAGNPVIAKAHPGHPYTSTLLANAAVAAAAATDMPSGIVQMLYHTESELGLKLVSHPVVAAVAFTGSRPGGLALKEAADRAGKPIYLEMSSVNPVFVLKGALQERAIEIAGELHGSCALGAGQFCTKPGIAVLAASENTNTFMEEMKRLTSTAAPGVLLTPQSPPAVAKAVTRLRQAGAELITGGEIADGPSFAFQPTLLRVTGKGFLENPQALQSEAFGHVSLLVTAESNEQLLAIARSMEGNLTGSIYSDTKGSDDATYAELEPSLRTKVGRLLNDKMPTGVAVSPAMNHGGPFPATGHPGFTAVGFPASIIRFSALRCYDNVRSSRLPKSLQDKNPTGSMLRLINGEWSSRDVG